MAQVCAIVRGGRVDAWHLLRIQRPVRGLMLGGNRKGRMYSHDTDDSVMSCARHDQADNVLLLYYCTAAEWGYLSLRL